MSSIGKSRKLLSLRELHLNPHFVYMVDHVEPLSTNPIFTLDLWKDDQKIGSANDISMIAPSELQRFPTLEFKRVRFAFDVQALFEESSVAKIQLKLSESLPGEGSRCVQAFDINILYYSYQFSRDSFVKYKENSIGKVKNYILNYSFSAIYGKPIDSLLFRKYESDDIDSLLRDIPLMKKPSKYGILVEDPAKKKPINTLFLLHAVADKGITDSKEEETKEASQIQSEDLSINSDGVRNTARSINLVDDALEAQDSNLTERQLVQEEKLRLKNISQWFVILVSFFLVYMLMHPDRKV